MWFVYKVIRENSVVYVGKGCGSRHRTSAKKHAGCAEIIQYCGIEKEAFELEKRLIAELRPLGNKTAGGDGGRSRAETRKRAEELDRKAKRNLVLSRCQSYAKARARDPLHVLFALCFARGRKDWKRFNQFVEIARSLGPWKPDPIWDGVYETFQKVQPIQLVGP